ncbi:MAG: hypothetical protein SFX72_01770 [Isosphaeraceae bacterium]|nr:hypothetical protein [Isosphaeraceae bacterium]
MIQERVRASLLRGRSGEIVEEADDEVDLLDLLQNFRRPPLEVVGTRSVRYVLGGNLPPRPFVYDLDEDLEE